MEDGRLDLDRLCDPLRLATHCRAYMNVQLCRWRRRQLGQRQPRKLHGIAMGELLRVIWFAGRLEGIPVRMISEHESSEAVRELSESSR